MKIKVSKIEELLLQVTIFFIFFFNYFKGGEGIYNTLTNVFIVFFCFFEFLSALYLKRRLKKNWFNYILFMCICVFSLVYTIDINESIKRIKTVTILSIFYVSLMIYLSDGSKMKVLLQTIVISGLVTALYLIFFGHWNTGDRLSGLVGDSVQVSAYLSYSSLVCIYLSFKRNKFKLLSFFIVGIFLLSIAISGSRSGIVACLAGIICFLIVKPEGKFSFIKKVKILLFVVCLLLIFVYLIMTNAILYSIIGRRFQSLMQLLNGQQSIINEGSFSARSEMRTLGLKLWLTDLRTLFIGNGIASFAFFYLKAGGRYVFAHNNFVELLCGVGVIGTYVFYFPHLKCLYLLEKNYINKKRNFEMGFLISLFLQMIVMHYSVVFYYQKLEYVFMAIVMYYIDKKPTQTSHMLKDQNHREIEAKEANK